jgi:hypothetical protein
MKGAVRNPPQAVRGYGLVSERGRQFLANGVAACVGQAPGVMYSR